MIRIKHTSAYDYICTAGVILAALVGAGVVGYTWSLNFLPLKYMLVMAFAVAVGVLLLWLLMIRCKNNISRAIGWVLALLLIVGAGVYMQGVTSGLSTLSQFTGSTKKQIVYSLVVLKDSNSKLVDDVRDTRIGAVSRLESQYLSRVESKADIAVTGTFESYPALVDALYARQVDAIVVNEGFRGVIKENRPTFEKTSRIIQKYTFYEENKQSDSNRISPNSSFNIFISGIDTYGPVSTTARSDVNILATVDARNHKILLTTIPRDSYVAIPGGGAGQKDKLTHAGLYGVDASIGAVEQLLDTKVAGYVRINFTSLIQLVGALGGVTVNNPVAFTSVEGNYFPAGAIQLNGSTALEYARERKNLTGGDNDRGKNQMRVITAIVDKMASFDSVTRYQAVLQVLGQSMQTNVEDDKIKQFISRQIDAGARWDIQSLALKGSGSTGVYPSYAMPSAKLYMYSLDSASISEAKDKIRVIIDEE